MKVIGSPGLRHFKASTLSEIYGLTIPEAKALKIGLEATVNDDVGKKLVKEGMAVERPVFIKPKKDEGGK